MGRSFVVISEWMLDLGLKGNELIAYALIWGFCKDGDSTCRSSQGYISKWLGITPANARACINRLEEKGFIEKRYWYLENVRHCEYRVVPSKIDAHRAETDLGHRAETDLGHRAETDSNNNIPLSIDNTLIDKKEDLTLPYQSTEFVETWQLLLQSKKWRKKEVGALKMALKLLSKVPEAEAIEMMQTAIAGENQGLYRKSSPRPQQDSDEERRRKEREQAEAHAKNTAFLHSIGVLKD